MKFWYIFRFNQLNNISEFHQILFVVRLLKLVKNPGMKPIGMILHNICKLTLNDQFWALPSTRSWCQLATLSPSTTEEAVREAGERELYISPIYPHRMSRWTMCSHGQFNAFFPDIFHPNIDKYKNVANCTTIIAWSS